MVSCHLNIIIEGLENIPIVLVIRISLWPIGWPNYPMSYSWAFPHYNAIVFIPWQQGNIATTILPTVTEIIGCLTNVVCLSIVFFPTVVGNVFVANQWNHYVILYDTCRPPEWPLFPFVSALMVPRLNDKCLKTDGRFYFILSSHGMSPLLWHIPLGTPVSDCSGTPFISHDWMSAVWPLIIQWWLGNTLICVSRKSVMTES